MPDTKLLDLSALQAVKDYSDKTFLYRKVYEVDAVTRPSATYTSNYVVYHITASEITSLEEGMTVRVHKGFASEWPNDSGGALKCLQINNLDPIALFWRSNSMATWNNFDNVYMTLTYTAEARTSTSNYYGYTSKAGFILDFTYDSGNDTYNLYDYSCYRVGATLLQPYTMVGTNEAGQRVPIVKQDGTPTGVAFDYTRGVQWWETDKAANTDQAPWNGSAWHPRMAGTVLSSLTSRWNLQTLSNTDRIYLKCTKSGRSLTMVAITKTLPNTADGFYYMLVAKPYQVYSSYTGNQNWTFLLEQPIFYHNGSEVVSLSDTTYSLSKIGDEDVYGIKTFCDHIQINGDDDPGVADDIDLTIYGDRLSIYNGDTGHTTELYLPDKNGTHTLATLDDCNIEIVDLTAL